MGVKFESVEYELTSHLDMSQLSMSQLYGS